MLLLILTYFIAKYDTAMGLGHKFSQHYAFTAI